MSKVTPVVSCLVLIGNNDSGMGHQFRRRENAVKKRSRIRSILLAEVIALSCLWPSSTVMAQRVAAPLDKNDPELRAILTEIEADAEKARLKAQIPGMSIVIVHDQDVLLSKGSG